MGEGFGPLIQMYPHSVQADLIRMKPEPIHYVCSGGAQADTPPLQLVKPKIVSEQHLVLTFCASFLCVHLHCLCVLAVCASWLCVNLGSMC